MGEQGHGGGGGAQIKQLSNYLLCESHTQKENVISRLTCLKPGRTQLLRNGSQGQ